MRLPSLVALLLCAPGALRGQTACPTPWQLEEVLRIGSAESTDLVSSVMDLAIGPDSALYVAQAMEPSVTAFSIDGQVLRRIGRAGRGPGDFELLARGVGWIGDTLWVADLNRIQLFTTDERVPAQVIQFSRSVPEEGSRLGPGRMLSDGTLIGRRRTTDGRAWSSRGENPGLALRRLSRSGEVLDTIAPGILVSRSPSRAVTKSGAPRMTISASRTFTGTWSIGRADLSGPGGKSLLLLRAASRSDRNDVPLSPALRAGRPGIADSRAGAEVAGVEKVRVQAFER